MLCASLTSFSIILRSDASRARLSLRRRSASDSAVALAATLRTRGAVQRGELVSVWEEGREGGEQFLGMNLLGLGECCEVCLVLSVQHCFGLNTGQPRAPVRTCSDHWTGRGGGESWGEGWFSGRGCTKAPPLQHSTVTDTCTRCSHSLP